MTRDPETPHEPLDEAPDAAGVLVAPPEPSAIAEEPETVAPEETCGRSLPSVVSTSESGVTTGDVPAEGEGGSHDLNDVASAPPEAAASLVGGRDATTASTDGPLAPDLEAGPSPTPPELEGSPESPKNSGATSADLRRNAALVGAIAAALMLALGGHLAGRGSPLAGASGDAGAETGSFSGPLAASAAPTGLVLPSPKDPPPAPQAPPVWRVALLRDDANVTFIEGTVGKKTLSGALSHAGMPTRDIHRLLKAFDGKKKLDRLRPKDTFAFAVDKAKGRLVAFELSTSPEDVWQAREENDTLTVTKLELSVERRRVAVGFAVTGELHEAVTHAGLDDDAMKRLDDALDGHFELSDLRPGTRIRLVLTELRVEGALARYAHVDAVEVHPPVGNTTVRVYHFDEGDGSDGKDRGKEKKPRHHDRPTGFFDAKGHQPYHGGWRSPVPGARISSRFNPTRMHPVLHVVMPHNGIDFAAPTGAKVYASSAGTVASAGNGGPCGNMVQIEHPGGLVTAYCHLSKFAAGLHQGQHVDTRQLIGYVGATGRVTGPHLHFALKKELKFVDPMSLKMDGVRVLPARDREAFASARATLDAALDGIPLPSAIPAADAGTKDDELYDDGVDESDGGAGSTKPNGDDP